jgi:hypothetical protein
MQVGVYCVYASLLATSVGRSSKAHPTVQSGGSRIHREIPHFISWVGTAHLMKDHLIGPNLSCFLLVNSNPRPRFRDLKSSIHHRCYAHGARWTFTHSSACVLYAAAASHHVSLAVVQEVTLVEFGMTWTARGQHYPKSETASVASACARDYGTPGLS